MKFTKKSAIAAGMVTALVATGAYAAKDRFSGDRAEHMSNRVAERLDLNDTQKTSFDNVVKKYMEIRGAQPDFMIELKGKLKELAADETLTVEEVNSLRDEIKAEFDRRADIVVPEFVTFYNTLDNEQRAEIVANLDRMGSRFDRRKGGKRGWWGGRGHGRDHGERGNRSRN